MTEEQAKELKTHPHWNWICEEIDKRIELARTSLETTTDVKSFQERIRTLKEVKRLPQDVVDREEA